MVMYSRVDVGSAPLSIGHFRFEIKNTDRMHGFKRKGEERKVLSRHDEVVNNLECVLASSAAKYYKRHRYNNADQGVQQKE